MWNLLGNKSLLSDDDQQIVRRNVFRLLRPTLS